MSAKTYYKEEKLDLIYAIIKLEEEIMDVEKNNLNINTDYEVDYEEDDLVGDTIMLDAHKIKNRINHLKQKLCVVFDGDIKNKNVNLRPVRDAIEMMNQERISKPIKKTMPFGGIKLNEQQ